MTAPNDPIDGSDAGEAMPAKSVSTPPPQARSLRLMQRRLYDLGGRSRNLTLWRASRNQALDLTTLLEGGGPGADALLEALYGAGARKPIELARFGDPFLDGHELSRRLQLIERERRALEQETGANDLYLAWPMVVGQFPEGLPVRAPLVLLPIRLTQAQGKWWIDRPPGTAPRLNLTLLLAYGHYLRQPLPEVLLSQDLDEGAGVGGGWLALKTYLYELLKEHLPLIDYDQSVFREAIAPFEPLTRYQHEQQTRPGVLRVTHQGVLGLFALADPYLSDDFDRMITAGVGSAAELLSEAPVEEMALNAPPAYPLPSDPSQERALEYVAKGHSVLVHGPPGTGKSQLITNLIAGHMAAGRRVMLVCQKRAALDVVAERLEGLGLSASVGLVHDTIKDRPSVLAQLAHRLDSRTELADELNGLTPAFLHEQVSKARHKRDEYLAELEAVLEALHAPRPEIGRTAHELYLRAARRGPDLPFPEGPPLPWPRATEAIGELIGLLRTGRRLQGCPRFWRLSRDWATLPPAEAQARAAMVAGPLTELVHQLFALPMARPLGLREWHALLQHPIASMTRALRGAGKADSRGLGWAAYAQAWVGLPRAARREVLEGARTLRTCLAAPPTLPWEKASLAMRLVGEASSAAIGPAGLVDPLAVIHGFTAVRQMLDGGIEARRGGWLSWAFWFWGNATRRALVRLLTGQGLDATLLHLVEAQAQLNRWILILQTGHSLAERLSLGGRGRPPRPAPDDLAGWARVAAALPRISRVAQALAPALAPRTLPRWKVEDWTQATQQLPALTRALEDVQAAPGLTWVTKKLWDVLIAEMSRPEDFAAWATRTAEALPRHRDTLSSRDTQREQLSPETQHLLKAMRAWRRANHGVRARVVRTLDTALSRRALLALEVQEAILARAMPELLEDLGRDLDRAERSRLQAAARWIPARLTELLLERVPIGPGQGHTALLHQLKKKRQLWPLRRILAEYTDTILGLVPCWLVSPETASAIMPLRRGLFDLVIFDEGSQCFAERAIPALYRARQVVVAGDAQQLQPSALYQVRWQLDEDQEDPTMGEGDAAHLAYSLLDLARGHLHETMLTEHYRSQHPGLIAFSSTHFYQGRLGSLPDYRYWRAPRRPAIRWHAVPGHWEGQTNRPEAEAVVARLLELGGQAGPDQGLTVGVVTFNALQQGLITDLLEARCARYLADTGTAPPLPPGLFIKNIENVQGDERDLILFSVGHARDEQGRLGMQFGSLGQAGGANRLNVALTRSRWGMEIFTDLSGSDFRLTDKSPEGVRLLAAFITYARAGHAEGSLSPMQAGRSTAEGPNRRGGSQDLTLLGAVQRRYPSWQPRLSYAPLTYQPTNRPAQGLLFTDDRPGRYRDSALERWGWRPAYARRQRHWPVTLYTARALWLAQPPALKPPQALTGDSPA